MASAVVFFCFLSLLFIIPSVKVKPLSIESVLLPTCGTYIMKVMIGSPPLETSLIMDTGSDLTWTQCIPCEECFIQDLQMFDPTISRTYRNQTCGSFNSCPYNVTYADHSETRGVTATDTFTFTSANNQTTTFTNIIFGCGHKNTGHFPSQASGIFGLGREESSLISQLSSKLGQKFSYCLVEKTSNSSGLLQIGRYASLLGDKYVSTPFLTKNTHPNFYYLVLEGISVGGIKILNNKTPPTEGNIIIDSGTTFTHLNRELYQHVKNVVTENIDLVPKNYPLSDRLCYDINSSEYIKDIIITFHFQKADIVLKKVHLFVIDEEFTCFSMMPSTSDLNIFGNTAQVNFQIEYDLRKKHISFVPTNCAVYHEEVMKYNDGHRLLKGSPFLYLVMILLFSPIWVFSRH